MWATTGPTSIRIQPPSEYPSVRATANPFSRAASMIASAIDRV
jgi:hypothetical protein